MIDLWAWGDRYLRRLREVAGGVVWADDDDDDDGSLCKLGLTQTMDVGLDVVMMLLGRMDLFTLSANRKLP